jgi:hypothetical protein
MINQKNRMCIFKILKSSLLKVPKRGYQNYPPKSIRMYRLKTPPKTITFWFSEGCKMTFFQIFFLVSVKEGPGTYFLTQFFGFSP